MTNQLTHAELLDQLGVTSYYSGDMWDIVDQYIDKCISKEISKTVLYQFGFTLYLAEDEGDETWSAWIVHSRKPVGKRYVLYKGDLEESDNPDRLLKQFALTAFSYLNIVVKRGVEILAKEEHDEKIA